MPDIPGLAKGLGVTFKTMINTWTKGAVTVQFSSFRAMTPRARVGGASFSLGYWTVTAGFSIVFKVMPRPLTSPGNSGTSNLRGKPRCDCGAGEKRDRHQRTTFNTPVAMMLTSEIGIRIFQANA